jgi:HK97 family phage major capsid protein
MKLNYSTSPEAAETAWMKLCAKHGQPQAANVGNASFDTLNNNEAHEARKTVRRAINAVTETLKPGDYTDDVTDGLMFAGGIVSLINEKFQRQADADVFYGKKNTDSVMRNRADFEKHFETRGNREDENFEISDFLRGVANMRTSPDVKNVLSTGTGSAGGYTVPGKLMPGILGALTPASSLLTAGAGIVLLEEGASTYTTAAVDTVPTAAWRAEAGALAESEPAFRTVVAAPRSLSFMFKMSRELLADGHGLVEAINQAIAQSFAKALDYAGLRGTGTAPMPRGILNTSGIQSVTNGTNGAALASYANFFSAAQAIAEANGPMPTAAIMSPRSLVKLGGLTDTTGQPLRVPGMLENVKLIGTSQIPNNLTVGTSTDCSEIYIGDFSSLHFAMREAVSVQLLSELFAGTGEIAFACHVRADVVLTYPQALAVVTGIKA